MKTSIERAFELARSGKFSRIDYPRKQLSLEGYNASTVFGRATSKQRLVLMREALASHSHAGEDHEVSQLGQCKLVIEGAD